jgi:hypothetical protein
MRGFKEFFVDIVRKPPMLFPLVGLFHVLWLVRTVWTMRHAPLGGIEYLQVLWMLGYTIFWIGICDLRKWAALGYMAITILNFILFFSLKNIYDKDLFTSSLFLIDGLFSFFVLFYYKKFS